jgi:hypothetical protein
MADKGQLDARQVLAFLGASAATPYGPLMADAPPADSRESAVRADVVQGYREAAAVLDAVADLTALQPLGVESAPGAVADILGPDLIPATGGRFSGTVMLAPELRAEILRDLVASGRVDDALDANSAERSGELQSHLEGYLLQRAPALEEQSLEELDDTRQIAAWLEGVVPGVPSEAEVRRRAAYLRLLAPFETIAGDAVFRGRTRELDDLRTYIGVVPPQSTIRKISSLIHSTLTKPERKPAVSIYGPGGVGKSALVARFMLEHTRLSDDQRVPFAYLDFNRVALDVADPIGLAREMAIQLAAQFPVDGRFDTLAASFESIRTSAVDSVDERIDSARKLLTQQFTMMSETLGPRPYVVVLDTFELVQYRGESRAAPLWAMLGRLQERWPFLRVVISGRAPVDNLVLAGAPPHTIELAALDTASALAFLEAQGIADPTERRMLVKALGGIPLSLKLAASLSQQGDEIRDRRSLASMSEEVAQGYLFGRLLDHVSDERVRRVASPGLVLRRVNPQILLEVLNEPCALGLTSVDEAKEVFNELRREASLVSVDDVDGDLVHRQDLRQVMLKPLLANSPAQVEAIRRRAIEWYATQPGLRAKAEEVYHRLHLGVLVDAKELRGEVRSSVQAAVIEFPVDVQRWLATLGFDVPADAVERATAGERDAAAASQIEERLPYSADDAWAVYQSAAAGLDGASPLYRAGARIAAQRGDVETADRLLARGLAEAVADGSSQLALELIQEQVWLHRDRPPGEQERGLRDLADYAQRLNSRPAVLQHRAQSLGMSGSTARDLRPIGALVSQAEPDDVWALTPALRLAVESALASGDVAFLKALRAVVTSPESPFRYSVFPDSRALSALRGIQVLTYDGGPEDFGKAFLQLIDAWPYRVLSVQPPYGRVGEQLYEQS